MPTELALNSPSAMMSATPFLKQQATAPPTSCCASSSLQLTTTETKSGSITLLAPNGGGGNRRRQCVNVIVYRTSLEHFAVLYPQKKICRPLGVINLKNTTVERLSAADEKRHGGGSGFKVSQHGFDTPMTLMFLCEARDLRDWMAAFTPVQVPATMLLLRHQNSLPIVEEDEEM